MAVGVNLDLHRWELEGDSFRLKLNIIFTFVGVPDGLEATPSN